VHLHAGSPRFARYDVGNGGAGKHGIARKDSVSRTLILLGIVLVVLGLSWRWIASLGLGRLPGDIVIERQNFAFYFPITSALLVSAVLSLILWLLRR
jgi:hypothetical protein